MIKTREINRTEMIPYIRNNIKYPWVLDMGPYARGYNVIAENENSFRDQVDTHVGIVGTGKPTSLEDLDDIALVFVFMEVCRNTLK